MPSENAILSRVMAPNYSVILPILRASSADSRWLQEFRSFWGRLAPEVEFIFVFHQTPLTHLTSWQQALADFHVKILQDSRRLSRGAAVLKGLQAAQGEAMVVAAFDWSIPMGDILLLLAELHNQPGLVLGNRNSSQKKRIGKKTGARAFFEVVQNDRSQSLALQDPSTPSFAIDRQSLQKLALRKLAPWFYTASLVREARKINLSVREKPVHSNQDNQSSFRWYEGLYY